MKNKIKSQGRKARNNNYYLKKHDKIFLPSKKAQEEIFGFLLIVALIMIIGVLFLLLQKPKQAELENSQISNLLYSMTSYTLEYENRQMSEVLEECNEGDGNACELANSEMEQILDLALSEGGLVVGSQLRGCLLNVTNSELLFSIEKGKLSGNMIGSSTIIHSYPESIVVELKFFY